MKQLFKEYVEKANQLRADPHNKDLLKELKILQTRIDNRLIQQYGEEEQ